MNLLSQLVCFERTRVSLIWKSKPCKWLLWLLWHNAYLNLYNIHRSLYITIQSWLNLTIANANIRFNENGTPYATQFEDLYFSDAQGIDETTHVFIKHSKLLARWEKWQEQLFVIAETGFGTGLNLLVTMLHFEKFRQQSNSPLFRLHFISIEKFPISSFT